MKRHPDRISKKYLALELGYYRLNSKGEIIIDRKSMGRRIYTQDLVEEKLGLSYDEFNKIKTFDVHQSKIILEHLKI